MRSPLRRCGWAGTDPVMVSYHDEEWGVPVRDDRRLFEMLVLEGAQAGLSWSTVLKKRKRYGEVFCGFEPGDVARFASRRVEAILRDEGIVRHRGKVLGTVQNARALVELLRTEGSFAHYLWTFVGGKTLQGRRRSASEVPAESEQSRALSRDLKRRGFTFVGPTICYSFMQAVGLVNDHLTSCFRHRDLAPRRERSRDPLHEAGPQRRIRPSERATAISSPRPKRQRPV